MRKMTNLNIELPESTRQKFKKRCKVQGFTMKYAIRHLLQGAIDGEIPLGQVERDKLVLNRK